MSAELDYELVISRRAKRATLRVLPGRGLVVSVPQRFARERVAEFVQRNRSWIETALSEQEQNTPLRYRQWPPRQLCLPALGKLLLIDYENESGSECSSECRSEYSSEYRSEYSSVSGNEYKNESGSDHGNETRNEYGTGSGTEYGNDAESHTPGANLRLTVSTPTDNRTGVAQEIANELKALARHFLPPMLASYAHLHNLHYQRVSIRGQRTRWGSYSSSGTLSLNYKLLFLRRELVSYVLLHELAHTRYLDHSEAFWRLLRQLDVNARKLDGELRVSGSQVPPWLELAR